MFPCDLGQHMFILLIDIQGLGKDTGISRIFSDHQFLLLAAVEDSQDLIIFQGLCGLFLTHREDLKPVPVKAFQIFQKGFLFLRICTLICDKSCLDIFHGMSSHSPSQGKMKEGSQDQREEQGPENIGFLPDIHQDLSFHDLKHIFPS